MLPSCIGTAAPIRWACNLLCTIFLFYLMLWFSLSSCHSLVHHVVYLSTPNLTGTLPEHCISIATKKYGILFGPYKYLLIFKGRTLKEKKQKILISFISIRMVLSKETLYLHLSYEIHCLVHLKSLQPGSTGNVMSKL